MVSLVAQPATPVAIFLCCQALKLVSSHRAHCRTLSRRASSVGCSSSEDDSLDSLEGILLGTELVLLLPDRLDLLLVIRLHISLLVRTKDVASTRDHHHWSPPGCHLRLQHHPHEPLHTHLHGGCPPCVRVRICCRIPSHC